MRVGRTYTYEGRSSNSEVFKVILYLIAAALVVTWVVFEVEKKNRFVAYKEAAPLVRNLPSDSVHENGNMNNELVHLVSSRLETKEILSDSAFNVNFKGSVAARRVVEYCQWQEHVSESTKKRDDGSEYTVRTYYYVKGWHSSPILSIMFDQPVAHHNPLRNPYPRYETTVSAMRAGDYELTEPLVKSLVENSNFKTADFPATDAWRYIANSPAHAHEGFKYIGQGYFYSAVQESGVVKAAKFFGQLIEGTLLDYQIGDLFSTCNAGDIRVHFEVAEVPQFASVIGKVSGGIVAGISSTTGNLKQLVPFTTSSNYNVALAMPGQLAAIDMFERAISSQKWWTVLLRIVFSIVVCIAFQPLMVAFSIIALAHGLLWTVLWGATALNVAMCGIGLIIIAMHSQQKVEAATGKGN